MNTSFEHKDSVQTQRATQHESQSTKAYPSRTIVHAKLEMTEPGDHDEQEAEAVANTVVNGGKIARKISNGGGGSSGIAVSQQMESQLSLLQGGGRQMPEGLRNMMESGFGRDFSQVRLHTDSEAASMSSSIHAKAFTHGNDIYFNQGQFSPNTTEGQRLVAHELTHVVQGTGKVGRDPLNDQETKDIKEQTIKICNNVIDKLKRINDPFSSPISISSMRNSIKNSYNSRVNNNNNTNFETFNNTVITLLIDLKEKIDELLSKTNISSGSSALGRDVICQTKSANHSIKTVTCFKSKWDEDSMNIEEKAFTIIHEFSHTWIETNDLCYWSIKENDPKYCGNSNFVDSDKSKTASAIEYYIKDVYKGSGSALNNPPSISIEPKNVADIKFLKTNP